MNLLSQLIHLNREARHPLYLQLVNQLINLIQRGQLHPGQKLPGSRKLSQMLDLHRNTVTRGYEELEALGWIEIRPNTGTFVVDSLPTVQAQNWTEVPAASQKLPSPFSYYHFPNLLLPRADRPLLAFDDGLPDVRLAPVDAIARSYSRSLRKMVRRKQLGYHNGLGNAHLRSNLAKELRETRGMSVGPEHIMITRGTIMAIHLAIASILKPGDIFVVGKNNYQTASLVLSYRGATVMKIPVDEQGIEVEALERLCKKHPIRGIYVTPHHHHPTTVSLSPKRRLQLLKLASAYNFAILEDDYDYDFHYDNSPILPLASGEHGGRVLYVGSFTKMVAPSFRIGYLVGPPELIQELPKIRRLWDRQGDEVLEQCFAELLDSGELQRHLRKSWRIYKARRDHACKHLKKRLGDLISFSAPAGGMALWAQFPAHIDMDRIHQQALREGLFISSGHHYHPDEPDLNATRMGFASMNTEECSQAVEILHRVISP